MNRSVIKRVTAFFMTVAMLFVFASCTEKNGETAEGTTKEEKNYVITTEFHTGEQKLYDEIFWHDSSLCAVAYLGKRSNWKTYREMLLNESFSDSAEDIFNNLETYDAGGNDVYLFIPRFDRGTISAYTTFVDAKGKINAKDVLFSGNAPFYLICNSETNNVKVEVVIPKVIRRSILPMRDMVDGTVIKADGFQDITPQGLYFDTPRTTVPKELPTE